jgi:branched-subunit amino acid transport protein
MDGVWPWIMVLACAAVTYFWRAAGIVVAGRFSPDGALVRWVGCVAYAMLAGLFARMILIPAGQLAAVPLHWRIAALVVGVVVWRVAGRNVFLGTCAGVGAVMALTWWGGTASG